MKVCIVCEGSYPYVSGGVAGWVHMMCAENPDVEFTIWSVATTKEDMHTYKYELPANVSDVHTIYIGEAFRQQKTRRVKLSLEDRDTLKMLISGSPEEIRWNQVYSFIKRYRTVLPDIVMSKYFFECCLEIYEKKEMVSAFQEFLWTVRSMYMPLMAALSGKLPEADVYHAVSTGYAGVLASCASYVYNKPFLLSEHGIYTREREEDIIRSDWVAGAYKDLWISFFVKLSACAYGRASVVTSLFETNRALQVELGCPEEKIRVIPNGIDCGRFYLPVPEAPPKKDYFEIGAVLRIVPIKDIKTMLAAFYRIRQVIPNARLHILGNNDENPGYYRECVSLADSLGLRDVVFHGQVNVSDYMAQFDVLLLTSISEGQPLSVLEGMAAGKPWVCTNVGDCKGLLYGNDEFGDAGIVVPVMNGEEIAKAVIYLHDHPELMLRMGRNGQKRAEKYYGKEQFLTAFRQLYRELGGEV